MENSVIKSSYLKLTLKVKTTFITHWAPLIIWMSFIFIVSSIHGSKFQLLPFNTITQIHIEELLSYRQATFHISEYGLTASDLIEMLPYAQEKLQYLY